jgi:hypothetical protein
MPNMDKLNVNEENDEKLSQNASLDDSFANAKKGKNII